MNIKITQFIKLENSLIPTNSFRSRLKYGIKRCEKEAK